MHKFTLLPHLVTMHCARVWKSDTAVQSVFIRKCPRQGNYIGNRIAPTWLAGGLDQEQDFYGAKIWDPSPLGITHCWLTNFQIHWGWKRTTWPMSEAEARESEWRGIWCDCRRWGGGEGGGAWGPWWQGQGGQEGRGRCGESRSWLFWFCSSGMQRAWQLMTLVTKVTELWWWWRNWRRQVGRRDRREQVRNEDHLRWAWTNNSDKLQRRQLGKIIKEEAV